MNLMNYLPEYYKGNETMEELQEIIGVRTERVSEGFGEMLNQCFINTASSLLSRYEKIYGITVDVTKSNAFRRERILAKVRGTGTVTKSMLEETASAYSNGEVEVIENNPDNRFIIKFVGTKGIPANMADLTLTIEEVKPAHLSFVFEYTFNTWDDVQNTTWKEAKSYTWEEFRER